MRVLAWRFVTLAMLGVSGAVQAQMLPPGDVISGPLFRRDGTSVPSISTGADANSYLRLQPPTEPFTPGSPAVAVRTTAPTQFVRAYTQGVTNPVGGFIAGSNAVRGLNATQIRDVLALPFQPDSLTIVQVPVGTCMIVGEAAPILGNFAANPALGIPAPGPWGHGGVIQESLVGVSPNPGCANPQFVPSGGFINQQLIGASALSYRLRAGGGNAGAVATALDTAVLPALFTDMDGIYNSLDLINIGDPAPLRSALVQLDGEAYADAPTVAIEGARLFIGAIHAQMRLGHSAPAANDPPVRQWLSAFGAGGGVAGSGDTHGVSYAFGGIAGGGEHRFDANLLAGIAVGYTRSGYGTSGLSGSGSSNTFSTALYGSYRSGQWYADGVLGYGYGFGTLSRNIVFPGVMRSASGDPNAHELLSSIETGYRIPVGEQTAVTPFAAIQGIAIFQHGFAESGAGAIDLNVQGKTTSSARSALGAEVTHDVAIGLPAPLQLTLRAAWAHEFASITRSITAGFTGLPGTAFTVSGVSVPRDAALLGLGASLMVSQSVDLIVRYDGILASGASVQSGTAGLRVTF